MRLPSENLAGSAAVASLQVRILNSSHVVCFAVFLYRWVRQLAPQPPHPLTSTISQARRALGDAAGSGWPFKSYPHGLTCAPQ